MLLVQHWQCQSVWSASIVKSVWFGIWPCWWGVKTRPTCVKVLQMCPKFLDGSSSTVYLCWSGVASLLLTCYHSLNLLPSQGWLVRASPLVFLRLSISVENGLDKFLTGLCSSSFLFLASTIAAWSTCATQSGTSVWKPNENFSPPCCWLFPKVETFLCIDTCTRASKIPETGRNLRLSMEFTWGAKQTSPELASDA